MSDNVDRLLPLLLENRELNQKGVQLLQKTHQQIGKKSDEDRTADEWFILGYYAQQVQQYDDALAHYAQAVLKNPEFEAAYKFRAMVCIDTQEFDDAEYDLNKALELDPTYTDALFERARMYHEMDQDDKAIAELNALVEKDQTFSDAYALLGSTYEKSGKYKLAVEAFDKAIALEPENGHYFTQRGLAHYFADQFEPARVDLEKAQKITGTNHITQFNLALVLSQMNDHIKDAFRSFEKAFKKAPDMLNHFYEQSGNVERKRLDSRLQNIVKQNQDKEEKEGSQFYRLQLIQLLERKLGEARSKATR